MGYIAKFLNLRRLVTSFQSHNGNKATKVLINANHQIIGKFYCPNELLLVVFSKRGNTKIAVIVIPVTATLGKLRIFGFCLHFVNAYAT